MKLMFHTFLFVLWFALLVADFYSELQSPSPFPAMFYWMMAFVVLPLGLTYFTTCTKIKVFKVVLLFFAITEIIFFGYQYSIAWDYVVGIKEYILRAVVVSLFVGVGLVGQLLIVSVLPTILYLFKKCTANKIYIVAGTLFSYAGVVVLLTAGVKWFIRNLP